VGAVREGGTEHCLRGPAHERDRILARQPGDIDQPDQRLDAGSAADGKAEPMDLLVGELPSQGVQCFLDPRDRPSLPEGQTGALPVRQF
jgi:hypothetical protein